MKLWRRETERTSHYLSAVAAVRRRRVARVAFSSGGCVPSQSADVRAYEPTERLAQRDAQARTLVANARDIPRNWKPDEPKQESRPVDQALLRLCIFSGVLLGTLALAVLICMASNYAPTISDGFTTLFACFVMAIAVVRLREFRSSSSLEKVEIVITLLFLLGVLLWISRAFLLDYRSHSPITKSSEPRMATTSLIM